MINIKNKKKEFLLELMNKNIKKVLDLGCGKAIMSRFFVKQGAKAIGIDIKKRCEDFDNFKFIEGNIINTDFGEDNNLIIASLVLHFYKKEITQRVIEKMKKATSLGGYNLLICMSNEDEAAKRKLENFYPTLQELENFYSDWKIIKKLNDITEIEEHGEQGPHQHNLIFLLVQKK